MTIQEFKTQALETLKDSPTPALDVDVILQWALGLDRTHLLLERGRVLSGQELEKLDCAIQKRSTGFPVAYITGKKEFFGYDFFVSPDVLIPKPDTELLVELALTALREKQAAHPHQILQVLDMCSGSGCVGISIFKEFVGSEAFADEQEGGSFLAGGDGLDGGAFQAAGATRDPAGSRDAAATSPRFHFADISASALAVTRKNAEALIEKKYQDRLSFVQTNLFELINFKYDLIVTNPPYVPGREARDLLKDGRSEPLLALDGDVTEKGEASGTNDGLALIRRLIPQAVAHLNPRGVLLMETGEYNAEETARLFEAAGLRQVRIEKDLSGQLRDVYGVL